MVVSLDDIDDPQEPFLGPLVLPPGTRNLCSEAPFSAPINEVGGGGDVYSLLGPESCMHGAQSLNAITGAASM